MAGKWSPPRPAPLCASGVFKQRQAKDRGNIQSLFTKQVLQPCRRKPAPARIKNPADDTGAVIRVPNSTRPEAPPPPGAYQNRGRVVDKAGGRVGLGQAGDRKQAMRRWRLLRRAPGRRGFNQASTPFGGGGARSPSGRVLLAATIGRFAGAGRIRRARDKTQRAHAARPGTVLPRSEPHSGTKTKRTRARH